MIFSASLRFKKYLPLVLALLCCTNAQAEKWYFEPTFDLRLGYDDNVRFTTTLEDSAFSTYIKADTRFGFRTELSDVKFGVALDARHYQGESDLDTSDQFFSMDAAYRAGLNLYRLETDFKRDSTRTSEELTTGFLSDTIRRNSLSLHPSWQRNLNERTLLQLGYNYTDTRYGDVGDSNLVDYRYDVADLGVVYTLTEKTDLQATLGISKYEADNASDTEFKSYWFQFGLIHKFTEKLSGTAVIGPRYTESDFLESEFELLEPGIIRQTTKKKSSYDTGYVLDLRLKNEYETFSIEGGVNVGQTPSGSGRLLRTNDLEFKLRGKLSERTNYSIKTRFTRSESTRSSESSQDRDYAIFEPRISWRASRWWTLTGTYRYRWQERSGSSDDRSATSNAIFISARYIWPRESLDRWMEL